MSGKYSHTLILIFSGLAALFMTACGSSRTVTASSGHKVDRKGGGSISKVEYAVIDGTMESSSRALLTEAKKWLGTPYKYGGEDKSGVDCSGLVLNVFRNALNIKLPRSSSKQMEYSSSIAKRDLIPGDLLFFATTGGSRISHVGMYIGEGKMVHSSTSRGVMVSRIEEDYFVKTFAGAGRVDAYYAMLSKPGKKSGNAKPVIIEPSAEPSFRFEPVAEVPVRTTPAATTAPASNPIKAEPVIAQSTVRPAGETPEISAEEARRLVLNSLIEQKLDSIYTVDSK